MPTTIYPLSLGARLRAFLQGRVEIESKPNAVPPPPAACSPLLPPPSFETLDRWRSSADRVTYARSLVSNPLFLKLLSTLASRRPSHRGTLDPTTSAYLLGWRCGQDETLQAILVAATSPLPATEEVPADYGASETEWGATADDETPA